MLQRRMVFSISSCTTLTFSKLSVFVLRKRWRESRNNENKSIRVPSTHGIVFFCGSRQLSKRLGKPSSFQQIISSLHVHGVKRTTTEQQQQQKKASFLFYVDLLALYIFFSLSFIFMREDTKQIRGAVTLANSSALFRRLPPPRFPSHPSESQYRGTIFEGRGALPKSFFFAFSYSSFSHWLWDFFFSDSYPSLLSWHPVYLKKKWSDRDQPIKSWMGGHLERKQPILFKYQLYPVQIRFQENSDQYYIGTYSRIRTKCKCQLIRLCKGEEKKMCWLIIC